MTTYLKFCLLKKNAIQLMYTADFQVESTGLSEEGTGKASGIVVLKSTGLVLLQI